LRSVRYTTRFNKDVRREGKSPNNKDLPTKLQVVIDLLAEDKDLPANLHDHLLVGEFVGMRELHVKPDLLLIYRKVEDVSIELIRLGSHSEIFG
jgi:mRNA interferase YafQ